MYQYQHFPLPLSRSVFSKLYWSTSLHTHTHSPNFALAPSPPHISSIFIKSLPYRQLFLSILHHSFIRNISIVISFLFEPRDVCEAES